MGAIAALTLIADAAAALGSPQPQPQRLAGGATVVRAVAQPEAPPFALLGPAPAILTGSGVRLAGWSVGDPQAPSARPRVVPIY